MTVSIEDGISAYHQGQRSAARDIFTALVQSDPDLPQSWLWLGRCLDDKDKKEYCFRRALKLSPDCQEAEIELDQLKNSQPAFHAEPPPAQQSQVPASLPGSRDTATKIQTPPKNLTRRILLVVMALSGGGVVFWLLILFWSAMTVRQAAVPHPDTSLPAATARELPTLIDNQATSSTPAIPQTRTPKPTFTPTSTFSYEMRLTINAPLIEKAMRLTKPNSCWQAIPIWDQVIAQLPEDDVAYYQRARAEDMSSSCPGSVDGYVNVLHDALEDVNRAIELNPKVGDYYQLRSEVLSLLGDFYRYQADKQNLYSASLENIQTGLYMGVSEKWAPDWAVPGILIKMGRCEEALKMLNGMAARMDMKSYDSTDLHFLLADSYLCLGYFSQVESELTATKIEDPAQSVEERLARAYYYMGRKGEALTILNTIIKGFPNFAGYSLNRHHLRALINYELGRTDQVQDDLAWDYGSYLMWFDLGLKYYVSGKLALDQGDQQRGIQMLQEAYARLSSSDSILRKRIKTELARLGAQPIETTLEYSFSTTPFTQVTLQPTSIFTPTRYPTRTEIPTIVPMDTETPDPAATLWTPTPTRVITPPPNPIIVDFSTGTGKVVLKPDDPFPVFLFKPAQAVSVQKVLSVTLGILAPLNLSNSPIHVLFWAPKNGNFHYIENPRTSNTYIDIGPDIVTKNGEIFMEIQNNTTETVELENIAIRVKVINDDGKVVTYGLPIP